MVTNNINSNDDSTILAERMAAQLNTFRQAPRVFPLRQASRIDGDIWLRDVLRTNAESRETIRPSLWASYNAASHNIRNANAVVDASIRHLAEVNMMLTIIRDIIDDAETADPSQREAMQYQIRSFMSNIDASFALSMQGVSHVIHRDGVERAIILTAEATASANTLAPIPPERDVAGSMHFQVGIHSSQSWSMEVVEVNSATLMLGNGSGNAEIDITNASSRELTFMRQLVDNAMAFVSEESMMLQGVRSHLSVDRRTLDINLEGNNELDPEREARVSRANMNANISQAVLERMIQAEIMRSASRHVDSI